jgi:molybdopterin-containing oxidoreductase family membrane subunit
MIFCNFVIPVLVLKFNKARIIPGIFVASIAVLVGMWLERLLIIAPSLANPRLSVPVGVYIPTFTEWGLFAGAIAMFILGFILFAKFFPIISIWEVREGRAVSVKEVSERVKTYLPETT